MGRHEMEINHEQRLYVYKCAGGYSCLGFDVLDRRAKALAAEMGQEFNSPVGTVEAYTAYNALLDMASDRNKKTGWRSASELTPQLVGLEGKRVEVVDAYGETRRFIVGKSTGYVPIHLEIARRNSTGGCGVMGAPFKSVRVVKGGR